MSVRQVEEAKQDATDGRFDMARLIVLVSPGRLLLVTIGSVVAGAQNRPSSRRRPGLLL
jgi:hypothetical protein